MSNPSLLGSWEFALFGFALLANCSSVFAGASSNLAFGAHYTYEPAANYSLTQDAGDATQLTDGNYAGGHFWTSRDAVGWKESGPIRIELDLGGVRAINSICMDTARGNQAGVSFPESVEMFVSSDRSQYQALGDLYQEKLHADGAYLVQKFCATNLTAAGRYVLLVIQPKGPFVFLDEIEVLGAVSAAADGNQPTVLLKRAEIPHFLKESQSLRHRQDALAWLAGRLASSFHNVRPGIQARINTLVTKLQQVPVRKSEKLDKLQDDLFALHRAAMSDVFKEPLVVWQTNPWANFSPIDTPTPDAVIRTGLNFDLMQRGSASNAFILTNNSDKAQSLKVTAEFMGGSATTPQIIVREVTPVVAASQEMVGDALTPLENGGITIKPGESRQVWLTVLSGASSPGLFVGKIIVRSVKDDVLIQEIALQAKVWTAAFPERQHVYVNVWSYLNWRPIQKFPQWAISDLVAHHVNVFVVHPSQIPWPTFQKNLIGTADFAGIDEVLRYQRNAGKLLFFLDFNDEKLRTFGRKYEFMSGTWKRVFSKWLRDWTTHLKAQGLDYKDFAFYPVDEPRNGAEIGYLLDVSRLIKEVDPKLQVYTTIGEPPGAIDLFRLAQTVDIFQLNVSAYSEFQKTLLGQLNKEIWMYSALGGGKQADPMGYYRLQAWKAFSDGLTGIGFWAYADTGPVGTAWNDFDGTRPDYAVIYEGGNGPPISSKRWEAWRAGVEDYELLLLARQKLKPGKELAEFNTKIGYVLSNAGDYRQFEIIRRYLLSAASR